MVSFVHFVYKRLKRFKIFYFLRVVLFDTDYHRGLIEERKCNKKSVSMIKKEKKILRHYWHCYPVHYVRYGLYDKSLPLDRLLDYIPPYYFYGEYAKKIYGGKSLKKYGDKYQMYNIFTQRNIPTEPVLAVWDNGRILSENCSSSIPLDDLLTRVSDGEKLFIKPVTGQGGDGILVLKNKDGIFYLNGAELSTISLTRLLKRNQMYIFQKGIVQRSDFAMINPDSVNTLRVISQFCAGEVFVPVCVLRMGRDGKDVDNSHQGGLSIEINVEDGSFASCAVEEHGDRLYAKHPDTGFVFDGVKIAGWEFIKNAIIDSARKFPELPEIAWDVAVVNDGIEMIELNVGYGIDHLQCTCGGLRRRLGVYPL